VPPSRPGPLLGPSLPQGAALQGPSLPAAPPGTAAGPSAPERGASDSDALLRDLTLPPVPNLEIPPSPPGTPPPTLDALNRKFETFLELKRKGGTHFNARLAESTAARNPGLTDKLMGFVGVDVAFADAGDAGDAAPEGGRAEKGRAKSGDPTAQYATTLPKELWDPGAFPEWAYKGALRKAQDASQNERVRGAGEPVGFVSASAPSSRAGSRAGTPGLAAGGVATGKRKTRFDA